MDVLKFVVAPDSFKGSISSADAGRAIAKGIKKALPGAETISVPIADGGEGTLDAITKPENRFVRRVTGPCFSPVDATWGFTGDTAVIEMAQAAGLTLTGENRRASLATTYGVGELILAALEKGFRKLLITAGGSATNDGGCGMAAALGAKFLDGEGREFIPTGKSLCDIVKIDISGLDGRLSGCEISIATDIKNPLLGPTGATAVYAPQKGADADDLELMERGMSSYAALLSKMTGRDIANVPGCGAAGGLPSFPLAFLGAGIRRGIDTVLAAADFDSLLEGASAVITGEGRIDRQSLYGKAISGVCAAAARRGVKVYVIAGSVGDDPQELMKMGIEKIYALVDFAPDVDSAKKNAAHWLEIAAEAFAESAFNVERSETHN